MKNRLSYDVAEQLSRQPMTYRLLNELFKDSKIEFKERDKITLGNIIEGTRIMGFNRSVYLKFSYILDGKPHSYEEMEEEMFEAQYHTPLLTGNLKVNERITGILLEFLPRDNHEYTDNVLDIFDLIKQERLKKFRREDYLKFLEGIEKPDNQLEVTDNEHMYEGCLLYEYFQGVLELPILVKSSNRIERKVSELRPITWMDLHRFGSQGQMFPYQAELSVPLTEGHITVNFHLRTWEHLFHTPQSISELVRNMLLNETTINVNITPKDPKGK